MSDNIPPHEIQLEIIKKVTDVKALVRFRSVSKPWKAFIDGSEFISGYGVRDTQPHRLLLRYKESRYPFEVKYVSFVDGENDILTRQQDFAPNVSDLVKHLKYPALIGSSCGLWCFRGYNSLETQEMLVIWNPSIRKSVGIVVPQVLENTSFKVTHFCFGVCPSTYDPTIVAFSGYYQRNYKQHITWQVVIFTLSSKTWKMIPTSNLLRKSVTFQFSAQLAIDRFIYWLAYDEIVTGDVWLNSMNLIMSFDLITHKFKEVNLPVSIANDVQSISISKLNESLVVSAYTSEGDRLVYEVWMMGEEDGVTTSFKKLFNIKTPDDLLISKVLGFTVSGEPIMETEKEDKAIAKVKVYKPCSEHINDLGIIGKYYSFFICPHTETLLLVDHSDCSIIFNDYRGKTDGCGARSGARND